MRAAIYVRSNAKNKQQRHHDLKFQINSCLHYARGKNFTVSRDSVYLDDKSGSRSMSVLLIDAKERKFDVVLIHDITANEVPVYTTIINLNKAGIKLISIQHQFDTATQVDYYDEAA